MSITCSTQRNTLPRSASGWEQSAWRSADKWTRGSCETARMMNGKSFRVWQEGTSWVDVFHHFWPVSSITQNYSGSTALSKAQVERELSFRLSGKCTVPTSQRHTQEIKDGILEAAESTHVNLQRLHDLLRKMKTMSYDEVSNSIHLFFFDRATAKEFQLTVIPYKRMV